MFTESVRAASSYNYESTAFRWWYRAVRPEWREWAYASALHELVQATGVPVEDEVATAARISFDRTSRLAAGGDHP